MSDTVHNDKPAVKPYDGGEKRSGQAPAAPVHRPAPSGGKKTK